uniref:Gelsolin-like domain-containing protein n=1 Tax=Brassica campestris TaxID=3711 RepID=A0A3P5YJ85_BRACM|nr:unnamed protein product [Brassica rapa]
MLWHVAQPQVFVMFWQVTEIYNFTQDDLMTEDIFIVDCHSEIFVWVGQEVVPKNKLLALTIGELLIYLYFVSLEFIEKDSLLEKLSPEAPIYVIMEGGEPSFFTRFFTSWDSSKSSMHGNSFQRKLKIVKNGGLQLQINQNEELQPHMVVVPVFLKTHSSGQEPCL